MPIFESRSVIISNSKNYQQSLQLKQILSRLNMKIQDFVFVITGRSALPLAKMCVESIQAQLGNLSYSSIYVDDNSNYSLSELEYLQTLLKRINGELISLKTRHYQIGSISKAIPCIKSPDSIVCLVDGDDYLLSHALQTVSLAYANPAIAMTYGNVLVDFRPYQDIQQKYFSDKWSVNTEYPPEVWKNRTFREDGFRCFHFRTFRRWLWDYINPNDFFRPDGEYFHASGDSAYVFPMLELLSDPQHVQFIETPLYVYRLHEGNVHNYDKKSQSNDLEHLRFKMGKYPSLDRQLLQQQLERSACAAYQD
jgi:hypothetical protein